MAYIKTTWVNGQTPINETNLNHIEQGIYDVDQAISGINVPEVKTSNTTSDTDVYSCTYVNNALSGKLNTSSVKTSSTTSNADVYSCTYVNDALGGKLNTSAIKTTKTASNDDAYSCTYINNITDPESFTITPSYSTLTPTYSLQKIGNLIFLNCTSIFLSSISANTWTNVATIPSALKPATSITTAVIMASGDTGNITGHGRCELLTTGTIRVKVNTQQTTPMFTFTLIWTI